MSRKWVISHAIFALHCHVSDSTAVSNPFPTGDRNFNLRFCVRDLRVVFFNFHSFFFTRGEQGEFRGFRPGVLENKHSLVSFFSMVLSMRSNVQMVLSIYIFLCETST